MLGDRFRKVVQDFDRGGVYTSDIERRVEITDSKSQGMHTTNIRNIPPFLMLKAPEARLTAVKARLAHPTLHPQSDLTNMTTQDPEKQNL